jgi:hypothetical protein
LHIIKLTFNSLPGNQTPSSFTSTSLAGTHSTLPHHLYHIDSWLDLNSRLDLDLDSCVDLENTGLDLDIRLDLENAGLDLNNRLDLDSFLDVEFCPTSTSTAVLISRTLVLTSIIALASRTLA